MVSSTAARMESPGLTVSIDNNRRADVELAPNAPVVKKPESRAAIRKRGRRMAEEMCGRNGFAKPRLLGSMPRMPDNPGVAWLRTGCEGLAAMEAAMAKARHSIGLEIYIYEDGPTGTRFRNALVAAARRGVRVRVLI